MKCWKAWSNLWKYKPPRPVLNQDTGLCGPPACAQGEPETDHCSTLLRQQPATRKNTVVPAFVAPQTHTSPLAMPHITYLKVSQAAKGSKPVKSAEWVIERVSHLFFCRLFVFFYVFFSFSFSLPFSFSFSFFFLSSFFLSFFVLLFFVPRPALRIWGKARQGSASHSFKMTQLGSFTLSAQLCSAYDWGVDSHPVAIWNYVSCGMQTDAESKSASLHSPLNGTANLCCKTDFLWGVSWEIRTTASSSFDNVCLGDVCIHLKTPSFSWQRLQNIDFVVFF